MSEKPKGGLGHNGSLDTILELNQKDEDRFLLHNSVEAARRLAEDIHYDELTGVLNKKTWRQKLEQSLAEGGEKAVIFIDLTNFKKINDYAPDKHEDGNRVLWKVATVLKESFRVSSNDQLAHERHYEPHGEAGRLGGDEFAVLLDLAPKTEEWQGKTVEERMHAVLDRLNTDFARIKRESPLLSQYGFDVAIGGAVWEPGMDATTLLTNADHAMQANKTQQHEAHGKYR
jgi:diguanylate cyclase (GGDEF)-like protein